MSFIFFTSVAQRFLNRMWTHGVLEKGCKDLFSWFWFSSWHVNPIYWCLWKRILKRKTDWKLRVMLYGVINLSSFVLLSLPFFSKLYLIYEFCKVRWLIGMWLHSIEFLFLIMYLFLLLQATYSENINSLTKTWYKYMISFWKILY